MTPVGTQLDNAQADVRFPLKLKYEISNADIRRLTYIATLKAMYKPGRIVVGVFSLFGFTYFVSFIGSSFLFGPKSAFSAALLATYTLAAFVMSNLTTLAVAEIYLRGSLGHSGNRKRITGDLIIHDRFVTIHPADGPIVSNRYLDSTTKVARTNDAIEVQAPGSLYIRIPRTSFANTSAETEAVARIEELKSLGLCAPALRSPKPTERAITVDYVADDYAEIDRLTRLNKGQLVRSIIIAELEIIAINCLLNLAIALPKYLATHNTIFFQPMLWLAAINALTIVSTLRTDLRRRGLAKAYAKIGNVAFLATAEGIEWRTDDHTSRTTWESVRSIATKGKLIEISLGEGQNLYIPTRLFSSQVSSEKFLSDLSQLKAGRPLTASSVQGEASAVWPPPPTMA